MPVCGLINVSLHISGYSPETNPADSAVQRGYLQEMGKQRILGAVRSLRRTVLQIPCFSGNLQGIFLIPGHGLQ